MLSKDEFLCITHDKMDHAIIALSSLQVCNKMIYGLRQLPINLCVPLFPCGRNQQPHLLFNLYNIYVNLERSMI